MSNTVTALFDTREDAESAKQRLCAADIDADNVNIVDNSRSPESADSSNDSGIWASIKNAFLPDDDRDTYEEGVRRGGFLLTADVERDDAGKAVAALEGANAIDLDDRSRTWQSEGWQPKSSSIEKATDDMPRDERSGFIAGRRETERGTPKVRSYVTDHPVREQSAREGSSFGDTVKGIANEGIGNAKQGVGNLTGSENLSSSGKAQERQGEQQQDKRPDGSY